MPAGGARAKSESGRFGPDIFCVNVNAVRLPAATTKTSLFTSPVAAADAAGIAMVFTGRRHFRH